jgi:hypothetical protein
MRHIYLKIGTGEICRDAAQYTECAQARWAELHALMQKADAPFYKRVSAVTNLECEALYEEGGLVFELLVELDGTDGAPDISKPLFQKAIAQLVASASVLVKKVVPAPPEALKTEPKPEPLKPA